MAKNRPSFLKAQKERQRREKAEQKRENRAARRSGSAGNGEPSPNDDLTDALPVETPEADTAQT